MPQNYFSICIGRQLASGGRAVGRLLAERLGATYYDREILDLAARESGLAREEFESTDEQRGFFGSAVRSMSSLISLNGQYPAHSRKVKLFEIQAEAIRSAARAGNCIFIGRAADYILRDLPRCYSVFIAADLSDRTHTLTADRDIDAHAAERLTEKVDAKRAAFYNFYSGKTWGAASSYDLCLNVSRMGTEQAADIICRAFGLI